MKKFKNSRLSTDSRKLQTLALKLENLLRWSFFTFIYNRSSKKWNISYIFHIINISTPIVSRTTLVTEAWFFQRDITRATNVKYHHSNQLIQWSILLHYSDRAFILLPVTGSGMGVPNFKTAHDTATKITQNIVPTISSIYA